MQPDLRVRRVWDVDLDGLKEAGITGILLDIDNTIAPWGGNQVPAAAVQWIHRARGLGFGVCILSNNPKSRVSRFSRELGVPAVCGWVKPWRSGYERALGILGVRREQAVMIGDQVFTDVLGARRLGIMSILVDPLNRREPLHTRVVRVLERLIAGIRRGGPEGPEGPEP
ncbi:MAG: YqeG family HAD IIIA-type phosphatase [Bacillota bacterium]